MGSGAPWRADLGQEPAQHLSCDWKESEDMTWGRQRMDVRVGTGGCSLLMLSEIESKIITESEG